MLRKKSDKTKAKQKAWVMFSKYIRLRDCLETTDDPEWGNCVTCGRRFNFKKLQAGHFLGGRRNANLFDERGVHAQCQGCNLWGGGQHTKYHAYMEKKYGNEVINELVRQDNKYKKYIEADYIELYQKYKQAYEELVQQARLSIF